MMLLNVVDHSFPPFQKQAPRAPSQAFNMRTTSLTMLWPLVLAALSDIAYGAKLTSFCITEYGSTPTTPVPTSTVSATVSQCQ
jgi:hypothetical protein